MLLIIFASPKADLVFLDIANLVIKAINSKASTILKTRKKRV
tara:strand:- start:2437 stop:2562 length:126 start_codon:yes stop_codon:yes gene_type:complete